MSIGRSCGAACKTSLGTISKLFQPSILHVALLGKLPLDSNCRYPTKFRQHIQPKEQPLEEQMRSINQQLARQDERIAKMEATQQLMLHELQQMSKAFRGATCNVE